MRGEINAQWLDKLLSVHDFAFIEESIAKAVNCEKAEIDCYGGITVGDGVTERWLTQREIDNICLVIFGGWARPAEIERRLS